MKIILKEGHILQYDGEEIKIYGSNLENFVVNEDVVVALDNRGRIHEYRHGNKIRSYGFNIVDIRLKNGIVIGSDKKNNSYEYVEGLENQGYLSR